jgi:Na+/H+-dicarboxylate symporter
MSFIDKNNLSTFGIGFGLFIVLPLFVILMIHFLYSDTNKTSIPKNISTSSSKYVSANSSKSSNYGTPKSRASLNTRQYEGSKMLDDLESELGLAGRVNKKTFLNFKNIFLLMIGITLGYIIEKSQKLISF